MQSTTMFGNTTTTTTSTVINGGKIQFHGVKTIYPIGERVCCLFTVPEVCQPECGDWIGIYPVGWTSIVRDCVVRQMVPVEQVIAGQCGQVEFDSWTLQQQYVPQQQYQFVYVTNNGEYTILGSSMPFRFICGGEQQKPSSVFGGEWYPTEMFGKRVPREFVGRQMPVAVECEMEKLHSELCQLEQACTGEQQQQKPFAGAWCPQPSTTGGVWQPRHLLKNVEQILKEKIRIEQAQRRVEQLCVLAQLKSFERHIVCVQKREAEIRDYLLRTKIQAKIAAFEQKVHQVVGKMSPGFATATPVEQYVRKYEQLLREKVQLDMEKRRIVLHKLRLTIRDCERKLRELQTIDQEHLVNFCSMLKSKFEQFYAMRTLEGGNSEWCQSFEACMGSFWMEQEKLSMHLMQAQRDLVCLCGEICAKLQEFEMVECYSSLRIPRVIPAAALMFQSHPKLAQIVQLERKVAEQKLKLKLRWLQQAGWTTTTTTVSGQFGGRFVEQLTRGVWFAPIVEKLRTIQLHLAKVCPQATQPPRSSGRFFWIEKKQQLVAEIIRTLTQLQSELVCPTTSAAAVFDHVKLRQVLVQLQQLKERECVEIPRFFQQECPTLINPATVVELCQHLSEIVCEKAGELGQWFQCFQPQFFQMQQQMPVECMWTQSMLGGSRWEQHQSFFAAMLELVDIERKLVEMKGLALATVHYMHLDERLVELEQWIRVGGGLQQHWTGETVGKRFVDKLRQLKSLIGEHVEYPSTFLTTGSFLTVPEHFYQHQQKYEKLCQLIGELECHMIELPIQYYPIQYPIQYPTTTTTTTPFEFFGREQQQQQPWTVGGKPFFFFFGQRFLKLVQEFQMQFPECFTPKCEEIVSFLRQWIVCGGGEQKPIQQRGFPFASIYGQQQEKEQLLREKLVEFETILCQPECEIACLTTAIFPQSTTATFKSQRECLKYLIRQVRELKTELCQWTPVMSSKGVWCQPTCEREIFAGEDKLVDMWSKKMWTVEGGRRVFPTTTVVETTTCTGEKKPFGLIRPVEKVEKIEKIEKIVCGGGEEMPSIKFSPRFGSQYEFVDECDFVYPTEEEILYGGDWEKIEFVGGEEPIESCLCQIEKYMRKYGREELFGGEEQPKWFTEVRCPVCPVVDTTTTVTTAGVRRF